MLTFVGCSSGSVAFSHGELADGDSENNEIQEGDQEIENETSEIEIQPDGDSSVDGDLIDSDQFEMDFEAETAEEEIEGEIEESEVVEAEESEVEQEEAESELEVPQVFLKLTAQPTGFNWPIALEGTTVLSAEYKVEVGNSGVTIDKITLMNDLEGTFDNAVGTLAVDEVYLYCSDMEVMGVAFLNMDGKLTLDNFHCTYSKSSVSTLKIMVRIASYANVGEALSGAMFRLGIQDEVDANVFSAEDMNGNTVSPEIFDSTLVNPVTVRRGAPEFVAVQNPYTDLVNGQMVFFSWGVRAGANADVAIARQVIQLNANFEWNGAHGCSSWIVQIDGQNTMDLLPDITPEGNTVKVVITARSIEHANVEDVISAGVLRTYGLVASNCQGFGQGDSVTVQLLQDSDSLSSITDQKVCGPDHNQACSAGGHHNTGYLFGDVADQGLTTSPLDFISLNDPTTCNLIWSDLSATSHSYFTGSFTPGTTGYVFTSRESYDWTCGAGVLNGVAPITFHGN